LKAITQPTATKSPVAYTILIALLSLVLFLALIGLFWHFTVDDAFITFRYADNLARGQGPVYNPGERVEGYTSFLWMLLMAVVSAIGWDPVIAAKVLGIASSLSTLVVTYRLARSISRHPRAVGWLAVLGLASSSILVLNTVMGLESPLYTLLLALAVLCLFREAETGSWWLSTLLFALAALTRPEGLAVFGLTWLYQVIFARERWQAAIARLALFGAIVGAHLLWRWSYYGDLVPATYYAKTGDLLPRLKAGLYYLVEFLIGPGVFLAVAYLLALRQRNRKLGYLLWLCGGYAAVIVWEGGDWMPGLRFWAPILPFLYLILADVLINSYHRLRTPTKTQRRLLNWLAIGLLGGLYLALAAGHTAITWLYTSMRARGYEQAHYALATWLQENTPPDASVALMDIGIVGYYSQLRIIDLIGLTEGTIAHTPGAFQEKVYDPAYVVDQEPAYIILVSTDGDLVPDFAIDRRIYESPVFQANYQYAFKLTHLGDGDSSGYYLLVFERRATPMELGDTLKDKHAITAIDVGVQLAQQAVLLREPGSGQQAFPHIDLQGDDIVRLQVVDQVG
jgi:arabinofuranosyltransferase